MGVQINEFVSIGEWIPLVVIALVVSVFTLIVGIIWWAIYNDRIYPVITFSSFTVATLAVLFLWHVVPQYEHDLNRDKVEAHYDVTLDSSQFSSLTEGKTSTETVYFAQGQDRGNVNDISITEVTKGLVEVNGDHATLLVPDGEGSYQEYKG